MKKKIGIVVTTVILLLVGGEIYLRKAWGLCDTVLIQSDPDFEYIAQPNQSRYRFRKEGIPFFVWLHPDLVEAEKGVYNREGEEIIAFCQRDSIPLIKGLDVLQLDCYRDGIHVNERGQKNITNCLNCYLTEIIEK